MKNTVKKALALLAALLLLAAPVMADTQPAANQPVTAQPPTDQPAIDQSANKTGGLTMNYKGITINFGASSKQRAFTATRI